MDNIAYQALAGDLDAQQHGFGMGIFIIIYLMTTVLTLKLL